MEENTVKKYGNIILENRQKLTLTGVLDIDGFSPDKIVFVTDDGSLTVTGKNMHVKNLSSESTEAIIEGFICQIIYSGEGVSRKGFFKRVLK